MADENKIADTHTNIGVKISTKINGRTNFAEREELLDISLVIR